MSKAKKLTAEKEGIVNAIIMHQDLSPKQKKKAGTCDGVEDTSVAGREKSVDRKLEDSRSNTYQEERGLKCLYTDATCLTNKLEELKITCKGYDILAITETWTDNNINDAELELFGYTFFRVDRRNHKGGRVNIYVKTDLQAINSQEVADSEFSESDWCRVKLKRAYFCLTCPIEVPVALLTIMIHFSD